MSDVTERAKAEYARLLRIEAAAKAFVAAWDGMREHARKLNVWDKGDETIYQSPVQTELRAAVQDGRS